MISLQEGAIAQKDAEREEINMQIAEWISAGGHITQCESGAGIGDPSNFNNRLPQKEDE